jgi:micrococcal nuclease
MKHISLILFVLLISSCSNRTDRNISKTNVTIFYSIKKFVDGDTFWVKDGSHKGIKIRLIGIDTPENQARFGNPEEYYGDEASAFVKKILYKKKVKLEFDKDSLDSFGRTLAYVYLEDGTFLNDKLVKDGYAKVMTVKPNTKFEMRFLISENFARNNRIGLWKKH